MTNLTAAEAVAKGAAFLDERIPNWTEQIDLSTLLLSSACSCVLGQLWFQPDDPDESFRAAVADLEIDAPEDYGFVAVTSGGPGYRVLTAEWKRLIAGRRAAP